MVKRSTFSLIGVFSLLLTVRLIFFVITKPSDLAKIAGHAPIAVALTLGIALAVDLGRFYFEVPFFWRVGAYFILTLLLHHFIHLDFSYFTSPILAIGLLLPQDGKDIDIPATAVTLAGIALFFSSLLLGGEILYTILLTCLYAVLSFVIKAKPVSTQAKN